MEVLFAAFGRFVVRFRYAIIVGWVLFGVLCVAALPSLSSVVKTQQSDFLPSNSPSLKAQRLELRFNPQGAELASLTLVAVARSGPLTLADHAAISRFEDRIQGFAHVQSVQDLGTSSDGKARQAQILAAVPTIGGGTADTLVKQIRSAFAQAPAGIEYHLTGDLAINYDAVQPLAIGIAVMLVAGLTLLPALLATFGRVVFWPAMPSATKKHREGLWARTAERVITYPQ